MKQPVFPKGVKVFEAFQFPYANVNVRSDGIVHVVSGEDISYTIKETLDVHNKINELTNCEPMLILHVPGKYATIDDASRKFIASKEGLRYCIAQAFVIHSMAQKMVANFFMRVNKPVKPTRFFNTQEEAENWLGKFRKK